jgi:hypothetical protein
MDVYVFGFDVVEQTPDRGSIPRIYIVLRMPDELVCC